MAVAAALLLFGIWSNSFIAISYLLGRDGAAARFDWRELTGARFVPAASLCAGYLLATKRRESLKILRERPLRLVACGILAVPVYNFALYYGQEHGIPAPIASLLTSMAPLSIMALAAVFLGERPGVRRLTGFAIALCGVAVLASAHRSGSGLPYPFLVATTVLSPIAWAMFTVLTKPVVRSSSPLVWTYLAITAGALCSLPFTPLSAWRKMAVLDAAGWGAVLFLSVLCTVVGFAIWVVLLKHLPASTVGMTVFLNPPLTTLSKFVLSSLFPATFHFDVVAREGLGGALALIGLVVAVAASPRAEETREKEEKEKERLATEAQRHRGRHEE